MRVFLTLALTLLAAGFAEAAEVRTWTSSDGKFQIEGEFVEIFGSRVRIRRTNGQLLEIEILKLSLADQQYAAKAKFGEKPAPNPPENPPAVPAAPAGEKPKFLTEPAFAEVVRELRNHRADKARAALANVEAPDGFMMTEATRAAGAVDIWWRQVLAGAQKLQVGDDFDIGGERAAIVQVDGNTIVARYEARNYKFDLGEPESVPANLASFAAKQAPPPLGSGLQRQLASVELFGLGGALDAARWKRAAVASGARPMPAELPAIGGIGVERPELPGGKKLPVPTAEARDKARAEVRELMKKDIDAARTPLQRFEVAKKFLEMANESFPKDGPSSFGLVTEAAELTVGSGNVEGTLELVDWLTGRFEIADPLAVRAKYYLRAVKILPAGPDLAIAAAREGDQMCDAALQAGQYPLADELCNAALNAARSSRQKDLIQQLTDKKKLVGDSQAAEGALVSVRQVLAAKPDDPDANLKIGLHAALFKRDWAVGLPHLAKGSDAEIAAAAKLDLAEPTEGAKRLEAADAWWNLSEGATYKDRAAALQERARHWYRLALPDLAGIAKLKAEKRLGN